MLWQGKIAGTWKSKKRGKGLETEVALWDDAEMSKADIQDLVDGYALFQHAEQNYVFDIKIRSNYFGMIGFKVTSDFAIFAESSS